MNDGTNNTTFSNAMASMTPAFAIVVLANHAIEYWLHVTPSGNVDAAFLTLLAAGVHYIVVSKKNAKGD